MAEKVFKEVTLDEKAWIEKRSRELAEHNRASELAYAREEALAQGEASGRAERELEMAKALKDKGVDIDIIAETSGLSKEEIEAL